MSFHQKASPYNTALQCCLLSVVVGTLLTSSGRLFHKDGATAENAHVWAMTDPMVLSGVQADEIAGRLEDGAPAALRTEPRTKRSGKRVSTLLLLLLNLRHL